MSLLIFFITFFACITLNLPLSEALKSVCLFKFEISTLSKSTIPIVPTPAAVRYVNKGQPKPPRPIIKTLDENIFFDQLTYFF